MDVEDWIKVGPGYRLRDGSEAEVLATDMGGRCPVLIRYRAEPDRWMVGERYGDGSFSTSASVVDLIRPVKVSDEALAAFRAAVQSAPANGLTTEWRRAGLAAAFAVMLRERGLE